MSELNGPQKVAVILMNIDQELAAQVMRHFTEAEAEDVVAEIVRMRRVPMELVEKALDAFHEIVALGNASLRGGEDLGQILLSDAFGQERAEGILRRVSNSMAGRAFEFLDVVPAEQIATLLEGEMAQTIALVLAHLQPAHASEVLSELTDTLRTDVAQGIALMTSATPESISMLAGDLKGRASAVSVVSRPRDAGAVGGLQPLVDIINRSSVATERSLLEGLTERDPMHAEEIRARLVTFADIVKLESRDVQEVLRGIDMKILAIAMKGSPDAVQEKIRENLSDRKKEMLDEETADAGPVKVSQVEEARAEVVRAIRELAESGTISVQRGDAVEDEYVE
jgi:flagellar motor switch protein FliG